MTNLVEMIAKALVDNPDKVIVTRGEGVDSNVIRLQVESGDMGKVIGKQGRIAKALRTVVKAAGAKDNLNMTVDILSDVEAQEEMASKAAEAETQSEE